MAGYTRQDTGDNIATGKVINAADFDNEYNQIQSAFSNSTGHKHDGTAAEGARITVIGPAGEISTTATAIFSTSTGNVGLGKTSYVWKDLHVDNIKIDGNVISSIDTDGNITLTPNGNGSVVIADGDLKLNTTAVTAQGGEINLLDGDVASVGTTAVAGGDGIITKDLDATTTRLTSVDTFDTYLSQTTKTLSNKTLTTPQINDTSSDHQYIFGVSELAADRTVTLPLLGGNDEFTFNAHTQTLTNKTLTTPVVNAGLQLKNGATSAGFIEFFEDSDNGTNKATLIGPASTADVTLTLPSATDTLVGQSTTDTLANKTLTAPKFVDAGFIADANGNEMVVFQTTGSAQNALEITNGASGSAVGIGAFSGGGEDANIDINITPKGSGTVNVPAEFKATHYKEVYVSLTSASGVTINLHTGNMFAVTMGHNITFTFDNPPTSGEAFGFTLKVTQDGTGDRTITWPGTVDWAGGSGPVLTGTAASVDVFTFFTHDAGSTWYGFVVCINLS